MFIRLKCCKDIDDPGEKTFDGYGRRCNADDMPNGMPEKYWSGSYYTDEKPKSASAVKTMQLR